MKMNPVERWAVAILVVVFIVVASIGVFVYTTQKAHAHSWYDAACCSDKDCAPITKWEKRQGGWIITTKVGQAFLPADWALQPHEQRTPYGWIKKESKDQQMHACMAYDQPEDPLAYLICLYTAGEN